MSLNNITWGNAVAAAIVAQGITDSAPVTPEQLAAVWQAICGAHITELGNADVAAGSFTTPTGGNVTGTGGGIT